MIDPHNYIGVKIALLCNDAILVYQRDNKPGLRFAGLWDLPGGGREGNETPEECIVRELQEECEYTLPLGRIIFKKYLPALHDSSMTSCFMVAKLNVEDFETMHFGEEGNKWQLMPLAEFLRHKTAIKPLQKRLESYLNNSK